MENAPRRFKVLLGIIIAIRILVALVDDRTFMFRFFPLILIGFYMWKALTGKESAAKILAILLILGALLDIFGLVVAAMSTTPWALIFLPYEFLLIGTAIYIFRSKELSEFYANNVWWKR